MKILLEARKFFCRNERCPRRIFTELLPGTVAHYARRSCRSSEALRWVTLALGGRAGARLGRKLGLLASGSTLLRELRRQARPSLSTAPRVLGIDEWAWKKGHRYGTILCDLEQGRVIDLLPDRSTEIVAAWLRQHPSVEVVSRDRAGSFGAAIARGAPAAAQVADRWHLLNNLFETLTRSLERHRPLMREVRDLLEPSTVPHLAAEQPSTEAERRKEQNRAKRLERYEAMRRLVDGGMNHSQAARHKGIPLRTVQRWLACGVFPERKERRFPNSVDEFGEHLEKRYRDGCRNATQLWREIKQLGFSGKGLSVWRWLRKRFGASGEASVSPRASRVFPISPQHVAWLILRANLAKHRYLQALYNASPQIAAMARTSRKFFQMIRARDAAAWPRWLQEALNSPLASFARRLTRDQNAVDAALRMPWSNGMVEGHIHRLKLLKRQMCGRAGFDLLRLRVLNPA